VNNKTVHLSLAGGLGNQLFQLAAALASTNGSVVLYDFVGNARKNQIGQPELMSLKLPDRVTFSSKRLKSKFAVRILNLLYRTSVGQKTFLTKAVACSPSRLFIDFYFSIKLHERVSVLQACNVGFFRITEPRHPLFLVGYFQSDFWPTLLYEKGEIQNIGLVGSGKPIIFRQTEENKVLALHIRLGDYANEPNIGILDTSYFKDAIDLISESHAIDEIWLFSDEQFKALDRIPDKWKAKIRVVPEASSCATLDCMRDADYYVISNSTFSWWGAFLSRKSNALVIAPNPWFKAMPSPRKLVPPTWTSKRAKFI
jgi:hypothetical protein